MRMEFPNNYNNQLRELEMEEANLENYLHENAASLSDDEVANIRSRLTGIKSAQLEINQILTGGFY